jgi:hypothetical protein
MPLLAVWQQRIAAVAHSFSKKAQPVGVEADASFGAALPKK